MRDRFAQVFSGAFETFRVIDDILTTVGVIAKARNDEGESFVDHIFNEGRVTLVWTLNGRDNPNTLMAEVHYTHHQRFEQVGLYELTIFFDPAVGDCGEWSYRLRDPSIDPFSAEIEELVREFYLENASSEMRQRLSSTVALRIVRKLGDIAVHLADREASRAVGG